MKRSLMSFILILMLLIVTFLTAWLYVYLKYLSIKEQVHIKIVAVEIDSPQIGTMNPTSFSSPSNVTDAAIQGMPGNQYNFSSDIEDFDLIKVHIEITNSSEEYWTLQGAMCNIPDSVVYSDNLLYPTPKIAAGCIQHYVLPIAIPHEQVSATNTISLSILISKYTFFKYRIDVQNISIPDEEQVHP